MTRSPRRRYRRNTEPKHPGTSRGTNQQPVAQSPNGLHIRLFRTGDQLPSLASVEAAICAERCRGIHGRRTVWVHSQSERAAFARWVARWFCETIALGPATNIHSVPHRLPGQASIRCAERPHYGGGVHHLRIDWIEYEFFDDKVVSPWLVIERELIRRFKTSRN